VIKQNFTGGNMPKKFTKIIFLSTILISLGLTNILKTEDWITYSTKNHPKSNGLNVTVRYPSDFIPKEVQFPYVVQLFADPGIPVPFYKNLGITVYPTDSIEYSYYISPLYNIDAFFEDATLIFDVMEVLYKKEIKHDNQKTFIYAVLLDEEYAGVKEYGIHESMVVLYNNNFIELHCGYFTNDLSAKSIENLKSYYQKEHHICEEFHTSLTFLDKH
jgi:hypothetical protein